MAAANNEVPSQNVNSRIETLLNSKFEDDEVSNILYIYLLEIS